MTIRAPSLKVSFGVSVGQNVLAFQKAPPRGTASGSREKVTMMSRPEGLRLNWSWDGGDGQAEVSREATAFLVRRTQKTGGGANLVGQENPACRTLRQTT